MGTFWRKGIFLSGLVLHSHLLAEQLYFYPAEVIYPTPILQLDRTSPLLILASD